MGFHNLLWFSAGMFAGSMIFGCIPLSITVSQKTMKWITTLGVGLLVGAAFIVIIPEGIHTVYGHTHGHGGGDHVTIATTSTSTSDTNTTYNYYSQQLQKWLPHQKRLLQHDHDHQHEQEHEHEHQLDQHGHSHDDHDHSAAAVPAPAASSHVGHDHASSSSCGGTSGQYIGISLATGFVFMLIVERLSGGHGHGHSHSGASPPLKHGKSSSVALTILNTEKGDGHAHGPVHQPDDDDDDDIHDRSPVKFDNKATLGILIHSLVDGVALGSMSVAGNETLEFIVFMAVILHKAPAAFGLASFLMYQGQPYADVRRQLFWFSIAAPGGALLTYALFSTSMWGFNVVLLSDASILGLVILFSGGTFLYTIAVHILPELQKREGDAMEWHNVGILVAGILAPYFIVPAH